MEYSLPADRVDFSSFACFKRTVEQIDFTPFLLKIFICVIVSDFDLIWFFYVGLLIDFTGLLSVSQSGLVIQVTHVVGL